MLEIKQIEQAPKETAAQLHRRGFPNAQALIQELLQIQRERKAAQQAYDTTAQQLNQVSREIGQQMAQKELKKAELLKGRTQELRAQHKEELATLKNHTHALKELLLTLPNLPHHSVPEGTTEEDSPIIHQWGKTHYPEAKKPHWELLSQFKLASLELGAKIAGSGLVVYTQKGAKIQRALISFFLDQAIENNYQEIIPPLLVNPATAQATGQLPDKEGMMYRLQDNELYLIPTAEVPVTNLYRDQTLALDSLPIRNVAYSSCFRREAGSWGAHVRGLNRLHQFEKVELVQIQTAENSLAALQEMRLHAQSLLEKLELPYRTRQICSGDLGKTAALQYDLEVWAAAQKRWLEVSSISLCTDYQARRLHLFYKKEGKKEYCHTLNGSALALPRVLAALLENNQQHDTIQIPKILHPYTQFTQLNRPI